jgi:uncharacterized phiE125 gp8 family phage protein
MVQTVRKLSAVGPVTTEPISLATARLHLRLDTQGSPPTHPDDTLVEALITTSREAAEDYTGLAIGYQTYRLALDQFPDAAIVLGKWPINAITSVTYKDTNNATQTVSSSDYFLDNYSRPGEIALQPNKIWPQSGSVANAVIVTFTAGFTDSLSPNLYPLPKSIKQAMLLTIGHLYDHREAASSVQKYELPMGVVSLLTPHRMMMGM